MARRLSTLCVLVALAAGHVAAGAVVTGRVFVDENKNGAYDRREPTLAKVLVSAEWEPTD